MAYGYPIRGGSGAIPTSAVIVAAEFDITFLDDAPQLILFAALQTEFVTPAGVQYGGNHVGLQWNGYAAGGTFGKAVNFGGYVDALGIANGVPYEVVGPDNLDTGTNLDTTRFPNSDGRTATYNFTVGIPVRFRVEHTGSGTWRATVDGFPYRDSYYPGTDRIGSQSFWTEYGTEPCGVLFSRMRFFDANGSIYNIGQVQVVHGAGAGEKRVFLTTDGLVMDVDRTPISIADNAFVTMPYVETATDADPDRVRVTVPGDIRYELGGYIRSLAAEVADPHPEDVVIRIDTGGDWRHDTSDFVRIVVAGATSPEGETPLPLDTSGTNPRVIFDSPPQLLLDAFADTQVSVVRYVDIFESDNLTPWELNVGVTDGNVTVDMARDERRIIDIQIAGENGRIVYGVDNFWYDKIIKPYRGFTVEGVDYVTCLGEFMIDRINRSHFPDVLAVSGKDFTKKLQQAKLVDTTTFASFERPEGIIRALAINTGITTDKLSLPFTNRVINTAATFDRLTPVWEVMKTIANGFGYELFFDNFGVLTMREFVDPLTAPLTHSFMTGTRGNLVSFDLSADDSRLFNEVVVYGTGNTNKLIVGRAENTQPSSPTRIAKIGRRTMDFPSQHVATLIDANALASRLLAVAALEQYDAGMLSIVAPWLEAGDAVEFLNPNASTGDPTRFLLTNFTIPMKLEPMASTVKRVTIVGAST